MTTNEAAERLRTTLIEDGWVEGSLATNQLDQALAAERIRAVADHQADCDQQIKDHGDAVRRATVERIRAAVREIEDQYAAAPVFLAILDEEAAR